MTLEPLNCRLGNLLVPMGSGKLMLPIEINRSGGLVAQIWQDSSGNRFGIFPAHALSRVGWSLARNVPSVGPFISFLSRWAEGYTPAACKSKANCLTLCFASFVFSNERFLLS